MTRKPTLLWKIAVVCSWVCVYDLKVFVSSANTGLKTVGPQCRGLEPFLVNLEYKKVKMINMARSDGFITLGYMEKQGKWTFVNRGSKGVQLVMDEADWKISGSIFKTNVYRLETIYFNVGENSRIGAEHHVNGKTFPMEMTLVHKIDHESTDSPKYSIMTALFEEMHGEDNVDYKVVIEALKELALEGRNSSMEPYILRNMFPRKADNYYAYKGKMAIPPCSEDVLWVVFENTVTLSTYQMSVFRKMYNSSIAQLFYYGTSGQVKNTPRQPLYEHEIFFVEHIKSDAVRETSSWNIILPLCVMLGKIFT